MLLSPTVAANRARPAPAARRSLVHTCALALVFAAVLSGAVVFTEPAPVDVLTLGLIVGLPLVGLTAFNRGLAFLGAMLLLLAAGAFLASTFASDTARAVTHSAVSLYLYAAALTFAAFVARKPAGHAQVLLNAHLGAAIVAATAGIVGYFDVIPGSFELFTKFGRASGPFKDPNVFGPFLVPAIVYALHLSLTTKRARAGLALAAFTLLAFGALLSFSRGAWMATVAAILAYAYFVFLTAERHAERARLVALAMIGLAAIALTLAAATQSDSLSRLLEERASLSQPYDMGPEGRFGGHDKAKRLILDTPLGLGAMEFALQHHHEDVHNVYLTMFLNAGWGGGFLYIVLVGVTLLAGFRHAFARTRSQPLFLVAYASLAAILAEGFIIDSDHWRHVYLLLGLVWGLMTSDRKPIRRGRIVQDLRPVLLRPTLVIPPSRRSRRIVRARPRLIELDLSPRRGGPHIPHRPVRILGTTGQPN